MASSSPPRSPWPVWTHRPWPARERGLDRSKDPAENDAAHPGGQEIGGVEDGRIVRSLQAGVNGPGQGAGEAHDALDQSKYTAGNDDALLQLLMVVVGHRDRQGVGVQRPGPRRQTTQCPWRSRR